MSALLLAACCVERTWGELFFYLDWIFGERCQGGGLSIFFVFVPFPNDHLVIIFSVFNHERKKKDCLSQRSVFSRYMFWYEIRKLRKGLQSSSTWSNCQKFANSMRGTRALTLAREKKNQILLFPCGCVCLFVCSSVWRPSHCLHRRSAVSWLALLLQRLSELPVGDWSTARPRSEDTLWQVCVWRTIFRFARA